MSGWYLEAYSSDTTVLGTTALLVVLAIGVAVAVPRRRALIALTGVSLALVLGTTLVPSGGWSQLHFLADPVSSILANLRPDGRSLLAWFTTDDGPLNVLLLVPLGIAGTLLTRRPAFVAAGGTALSLAIECWQSSLTTRVGSLADVVCNGAGAALGAGIATLALLVLGRVGPARGLHAAG